MGADPEPNYFVAFAYAEGSVIAAYSDRVYRLGRMHTLEAQGAMVGVLLKQVVSFSRLAPDARRKPRESFTEAFGGS